MLATCIEHEGRAQLKEELFEQLELVHGLANVKACGIVDIVSFEDICQAVDMAFLQEKNQYFDPQTGLFFEHLDEKPIRCLQFSAHSSTRGWSELLTSGLRVDELAKVLVDKISLQEIEKFLRVLNNRQDLDIRSLMQTVIAGHFWDKSLYSQTVVLPIYSGYVSVSLIDNGEFFDFYVGVGVFNEEFSLEGAHLF